MKFLRRYLLEVLNVRGFEGCELNTLFISSDRDGASFFGRLYRDRLQRFRKEMLNTEEMNILIKGAIEQGAAIVIARNQAGYYLYDSTGMDIVPDYTCGGGKDNFTDGQIEAFEQFVLFVKQKAITVANELTMLGFRVMDACNKETRVVREINTKRFRVVITEDKAITSDLSDQVLMGRQLRLTSLFWKRAVQVLTLRVEVFSKTGLLLGSRIVENTTKRTDRKDRQYANTLKMCLCNAANQARDVLKNLRVAA